MRVVAFTLGRPLPLLNVMLRSHHRHRARHRKALAWEVLAATQGQRPDQPFARARVHVERVSIGTPDKDGLYGSAKLLLDVLQPASARHPSGLGIIADDAPDCCDLEVVGVRAASAAQQGTRVRVEEKA